jgi:hypothetical protein
MEITDDRLRQIVRETLHELGPHADPAFVQKIVRAVVRQLLLPGEPPEPPGAAHLPQPFVRSMFRPGDGNPDDPSRPGY